MPAHTAIYTDNNSSKTELAKKILKGAAPEPLAFLNGKRGVFFSNTSLGAFLEAEARYDLSGLNLGNRTLKSLSSGERKKALLLHLFQQNPDFMILDDLFNNLDQASRQALKSELKSRANRILLLQFLSRAEDLLPYIEQRAQLSGSRIIGFPNYTPPSPGTLLEVYKRELPPAPAPEVSLPDVLIEFRNVDLSYQSSRILHKINWRIEKGDFWELRGPNGSGKTSLITMIIGDNPKAYGTELYLFGTRKGSGESVWDIKEKIGYFTPALTDRFRGNHSAEAMLISGLLDSVGLYTKPTDQQRLLAGRWLELLGLSDLGNVLFGKLSQGHQRLLMCARAMIKHPPVLILDEPTAGLDESSAALLIALVRKMAAESQTAIIFVSHRKEPGLQASKVLELHLGDEGSRGIIHYTDQT